MVYLSHSVLDEEEVVAVEIQAIFVFTLVIIEALLSVSEKLLVVLLVSMTVIVIVVVVILIFNILFVLVAIIVVVPVVVVFLINTAIHGQGVVVSLRC